MTWFLNNTREVFELALTHLALSIPAILLSVIISIPIGRLAYRKPRIGAPVLGAATLLYAIPAFPLLIVIPVIAGVSLRSPANMIIALTVYGVALLVRTAADAFGSVEGQVRDAAVALGNSPRTVFWGVELPLAVPVLIAGIRVVAVSTVSLVTIGALIGVSGLGSLLTDGFQRGIVAEVATGVVATVVIALVLDALILMLGRALTPWVRLPRGVAVARLGASGAS